MLEWKTCGNEIYIHYKKNAAKRAYRYLTDLENVTILESPDII